MTDTHDLNITPKFVQNCGRLIMFVDQLLQMAEPHSFEADQSDELVGKVVEQNGLEDVVVNNAEFKDLLLWRATETLHTIALLKIVAEHEPQAGASLVAGSNNNLAKHIAADAIKRMMGE